MVGLRNLQILLVLLEDSPGRLFLLWIIYLLFWKLNLKHLKLVFLTYLKVTTEKAMAPPLQYSCLENPMDGGAWWVAVHGVAKSRTRLSNFTFTFHFPALEKEMATHSSVLAWRSPGTGEPGGLLSMGSCRVGHNWSDLAAAKVTIQSSMNRNNILKYFSQAKNIYKNAIILYLTHSHNSYLFIHSVCCNIPHHVVSVTTGEKYKRTGKLQKLWPQYHQEP